MLKDKIGTEIRLIDLGMCARRTTGVTASGGRGTFAHMAPGNENLHKKSFASTL